MLEAPHSEVCLCGVSQWHSMLDRVLWCRRCGCLRFLFNKYWLVPLDRAGELAASISEPLEEKEPPTDPGTPEAKKSVRPEGDD